MKRKILRFDGGGGVEYGDSWADLTADEPVNTDPQTVYPVDGSESYVLDSQPEATGALSHLTPQQQEAVTTEIDNQNNSVQDPNLTNHRYPTGQDPNGNLQDNGGQTDGVFTKLLKGMGLAGKDGTVDVSNPDTLSKLLKVLYTGGSMLNTLQGPQGKKSPQDLQAQLKGPFDSFQGPAAASANSYFGTPLKPRSLQYNRSGASLTSTPRYAEGGGVDDNRPEFFSPGALSTAYVKGPTGGQADLVPARVAHGEYVFDADAVSAIGDGNNEAGANILDGWREKLREHKRSAPAHKIPPKFKGVDAYMPKGAK